MPIYISNALDRAAFLTAAVHLKLLCRLAAARNGGELDLTASIKAAYDVADTMAAGIGICQGPSDPNSSLTASLIAVRIAS